MEYGVFCIGYHFTLENPGNQNNSEPESDSSEEKEK